MALASVINPAPNQTRLCSKSNSKLPCWLRKSLQVAASQSDLRENHRRQRDPCLHPDHHPIIQGMREKPIASQGLSQGRHLLIKAIDQHAGLNLGSREAAIGPQITDAQGQMRHSISGNPCHHIRRITLSGMWQFHARKQPRACAS